MPKRKRTKPTSRKRSRKQNRVPSDGGRLQRVMLAAFVGVTLLIALTALMLYPPSQDGSQARQETETPTIPDRPVFDIPSNPSPIELRVAALRDESFDVSEQVVEDLPESPHAWWLLGHVHYRHANEATAAQLWETCLQLDPQFADSHFSFGMAALKKGDFPTAERWLLKTMEIDPAWAEVPPPLAEAMMGQGKVDEAIAVTETFLQTHPDSVQAWCRLGQAHQQAGDHARATRSYLEAVALAPDHAEAHYGAAMAYQ